MKKAVSQVQFLPSSEVTSQYEEDADISIEIPERALQVPPKERKPRPDNQITDGNIEAYVKKEKKKSKDGSQVITPDLVPREALHYESESKSVSSVGPEEIKDKEKVTKKPTKP